MTNKQRLVWIQLVLLLARKNYSSTFLKRWVSLGVWPSVLFWFCLFYVYFCKFFKKIKYLEIEFQKVGKCLMFELPLDPSPHACIHMQFPAWLHLFKLFAILSVHLCVATSLLFKWRSISSAFWATVTSVFKDSDSMALFQSFFFFFKYSVILPLAANLP